MGFGERKIAMNRTIQAAFLGTILVAGAFCATSPASAQTVVVEPPVAFGYSDGYWDREHHWRKWRDEREASEWRRAHHEHYYAWKHDRDRDLGWREREKWWDR
jgi:hypothetical protein